MKKYKKGGQDVKSRIFFCDTCRSPGHTVGSVLNRDSNARCCGSHTNQHAPATDPYVDIDTNGYLDSYSNIYSYVHIDTDDYPNAYSNLYSDANAVSHSYADAYADCYFNTDIHTHASAEAFVNRHHHKTGREHKRQR